jgi:hypothetical protein
MFEISATPGNRVSLHRTLAHTPLLTVYEGEVNGQRVALEVWNVLLANPSFG